MRNSFAIAFISVRCWDSLHYVRTPLSTSSLFVLFFLTYSLRAPCFGPV